MITARTDSNIVIYVLPTSRLFAHTKWISSKKPFMSSSLPNTGLSKASELLFVWMSTMTTKISRVRRIVGTGC